jgi:hypothetical protein
MRHAIAFVLILFTSLCLAQSPVVLFFRGAASAPAVEPPPVAGFDYWFTTRDTNSMWTNVAGTVYAVPDGGDQRFVAKMLNQSASNTNHLFMAFPDANERRPALSNAWSAFNGQNALAYSPSLTAQERVFLQTMTNNIPFGTTGITVFVVAQLINSGVGGAFAMLTTFNQPGGVFSEFRRNNTAFQMQLILGGGAFGSTVQAFADGETAVWAWRHFNAAANNVTVFKNGTATTESYNDSAYYPNTNGFGLGTRWDTSIGDGKWHGTIGDTIIYPWALSNLEVSNVNYYLTNIFLP